MATDAPLRLELLRKLCLERGWVQSRNENEPSPRELALRIERSVSYCNDLLKGNKSFAGAIARYIEEKLGVPRFYLDGGVPNFSDEAITVALMLDRVEDERLKQRVYSVWSTVYDALVQGLPMPTVTPEKALPASSMPLADSQPKPARAASTKKRTG